MAGRGQLRSTQSSQETSLGAALERRVEGNRAEKRDFVRSDISSRSLGGVAENQPCRAALSSLSLSEGQSLSDSVWVLVRYLMGLLLPFLSPFGSVSFLLSVCSFAVEIRAVIDVCIISGMC